MTDLPRSRASLRHDEQYRSTNAATPDAPGSRQNVDLIVDFVVWDGGERSIKFGKRQTVFDAQPNQTAIWSTLDRQTRI